MSSYLCQPCLLRARGSTCPPGRLRSPEKPFLPLGPVLLGVGCEGGILFLKITDASELVGLGWTADRWMAAEAPWGSREIVHASIGSEGPEPAALSCEAVLSARPSSGIRGRLVVVCVAAVRDVARAGSKGGGVGSGSMYDRLLFSKVLVFSPRAPRRWY